MTCGVVNGAAPRRQDRDLAAGHALADVVVRLAFEDQPHAADRERAEALAGAAGEPSCDRARLAAPSTPCGERDLAGDPRADGAVLRARSVGQRRPTGPPRCAAPTSRRIALVERLGAVGARGRSSCGAAASGAGSAKSGDQVEHRRRGRRLLRWSSRSARPTTSSSVRAPSEASISRTLLGQHAVK